MRRLLCALALMLLPALANALPEVGQPAPDFSAGDIANKNVTLSQLKGKIVVLEWNNPLCPFVKKHYNSENMQKLQAEEQKNGVVWIAINSAGHGKEGFMTRNEARDYVNYKNLTVSHYILDPEGKIGHLYGAKTTPHMFVIDKTGNIAYMGAIDDKPTPDPASVASAKNYVHEAVSSLMAGTPVATSSTQSYGCSVKYAD